MQLFVKLEFNGIDVQGASLNYVEISSEAEANTNLETADMVRNALVPDYYGYKIFLDEGESLTIRCSLEDIPPTNTFSEIAENAVNTYNHIMKKLCHSGLSGFTVTPVISGLTYNYS